MSLKLPLQNDPTFPIYHVTTSVDLRHLASPPVTRHTPYINWGNEPSQISLLLLISFVSNSFFCLSPPLALSNNWAIGHASHISTTTGLTQSANHRDRCMMGVNLCKLGLRFLSLWIDVSLTSGQPMHQELQNIQHYLLPLTKVFLVWRLAL